jgi:hypothetical protein
MTKAPAKSGRFKPVDPAPVSARATLTVRLRAEVRSEVERAAVRYGRSLSEEVESRLEVSFALKQYFRQEIGEDIFCIANAMASSLSYLEDYKEKSWIEDQNTFEAFQATVSNLLRNYRDLVTKAEGRAFPTGDFDGKSTEELGQMLAAVGGLAPPRVRKPTPAPEPTDEQLEARALSKASMRAIVAKRSASDEGDA